ncbi:MAG: DUF1592 domain-containing protein [Planctomycetes bacterium]|nr:DUF1592 domain-containing protein [Planctomycetota bacterium]
MSRRCIFPLVLLMLQFLSAPTPGAETVSKSESRFKRLIQPVLAEHCFRCHGPEKHEADLRLDNLDVDFGNATSAETWHDVLNKLNLGEMPPEDEQQPSEAQFQQVVDWLTGGLELAAAAKRRSGGHVVLRRLTRYEYNNTMHDLLGIDLDFAKDLPPEPSSEDGFKNSGAALSISPLQIEFYLQAARTALAKAIVTGPRPEVYHHHAEESAPSRRKKEVTSNTVTPDARFVARLLDYPTEGEIVVRVTASAIVPKGEGYPPMRVTVGLRSDVLAPEEKLGEIDVTATVDDPQMYEFRGRIEQFPLPGHNPKYPGVLVTVWNDYDNGERKPLKRARRKKGDDPPPAPASNVPTIVIKSLDFEGPVFQSWPPNSHTRILFARDSEDDQQRYVRKVIQRFATRAYRRPATEEEVDLLLSFFNRIRDESPTFEEAIRETLAMVLISPEFLYLMEPHDGGKSKHPLTDFELASRLSYFLWSSMPDEKLFALAERGKLSEPDVVAKQVRDMVADPKSNNFVEHFTDQWLNLSGLDRVAVNPEYYPDFDDRLKPEMRKETQRFFAEILYEDLSAMNLIDSDFAMLNRRLAKHYGVTGPRGSEFERVALAADDRRGGLLTQGSVLLSNSTGEDSHPIRRAVWLLDRLLDSPPAPPPPDVPELNQGEPDLLGLPLKKQLELHRQKDSCNRCHRRIDPWGIPFESYDAVGQWRSEVLRVAKKGRDTRTPVVASAILPGGHEVDGLEQLKVYLLTQESKRFSRALVIKLLTYSLGRSLELADEAVVESLTTQFAAADYRLSDLIIAIAQSEPFQHN